MEKRLDESESRIKDLLAELRKRKRSDKADSQPSVDEKIMELPPLDPDALKRLPQPSNSSTPKRQKIGLEIFTGTYGQPPTPSPAPRKSPKSSNPGSLKIHVKSYPRPKEVSQVVESRLHSVNRALVYRHLELEEMRQLIKSIFADVKLGETKLGPLKQQQAELQKSIAEDRISLQTLENEYLLESEELRAIDRDMQSILLQAKQLAIYMSEVLMWPPTIENQKSRAGLVALVVISDPFPMVISKLKQLSDEQLRVQLLKGATIELDAISTVKADVVSNSKSGPKGSSILLQYDLQAMDPELLIARFPVKFLTGTRKSSVSIRFSMQTLTGPFLTTLESPATSPFVIITNDCQWEGSEDLMLKNDLFSDKSEVPWPNFINVLQRHFLKATRQNLNDPERSLSQYDFDSFKRSFFSDRKPVPNLFDRFWLWYGKTMQTLRYKRHICSLWASGLLSWLIPREKVEAELLNWPDGTCLLLFSLQFGGQIEISYVNRKSDPPVKHYLVQPNDTSGSKKTLPDFLNECMLFDSILQQREETVNGPVFARHVKDEVLGPYYSRLRGVEADIPPMILTKLEMTGQGGLEMPRSNDFALRTLSQAAGTLAANRKTSYSGSG